MSFRHYVRRVHNSSLSFPARRYAFRSCIGIYCWTGNSTGDFEEIFNRYNEKFGLDANISNAERFVRAMEALETERNEFLEQLRLFDRKRIRAKARGRRNPSPTERTLLLR